MTDTIFGESTCRLITGLFDKGVRKFSVIMRHSARHYDEDIKMEPFMPLTEKGKRLAYDYGKNLPEGLSARFFSSYIGRCIETAYQIDKGFTRNRNGASQSNIVSKDISPFYIVDFNALIEIILEQETEIFIRNWLDNNFSESIIMSAANTAERMFSFMRENLSNQPENTIDISVTHDWNIYLLKELGLGLRHEDHGKIDYLEGIVLFEKNNELMIAHHQSEPLKFERL